MPQTPDDIERTPIQGVNLPMPTDGHEPLLEERLPQVMTGQVPLPPFTMGCPNPRCRVVEFHPQPIPEDSDRVPACPACYGRGAS